MKKIEKINKFVSSASSPKHGASGDFAVKIKQKLEELKPILKERFMVKNIGIFGSFARGKQNIKSDLDVLVEFSETIGLFKFIELENFLSKELGVKVDLVMKEALKPRIKEGILKEVVRL